MFPGGVEAISQSTFAVTMTLLAPGVKKDAVVTLVGILLNDSIEFGCGNMVEKLLQ